MRKSNIISKYLNLYYRNSLFISLYKNEKKKLNVHRVQCARYNGMARAQVVGVGEDFSY
jgi:hypothetical protein